MFSVELLEVASEILIVGGALSVIMLFFVLLWLFIILLQCFRIVNKIKDTVDTVISVTTIPLLLFQKLFSDKSEK